MSESGLTPLKASPFTEFLELSEYLSDGVHLHICIFAHPHICVHPHIYKTLFYVKNLHICTFAHPHI
ncbi:hypothetical protein [Mucilaginibacter sp. NFX135]|uniref:hypothetical protein n=1 Tax=Mucilaginibacter sp. NFX135 TaxID=3402687 RepID=UPI003AFACD9D